MNKLHSFLLPLLVTCVFANREFISPDKLSPNCTDFCSKIYCEQVKECNGGVILEKGSFCGCCSACVKYLDINETCSQILDGSLALVAQSICKPGTECRNGKCVFVFEVASECLRQKHIREKKRGKNSYNEQIWIPQCGIDGIFAAKQKKIRKSVCFDESGNRIFGSANDGLQNTCGCSRHMLRVEEIQQDAYNTEPHEHCTPSGSFASLQCIGNLCYCADSNTGQVKSHLVTRNFLERLPCYDEQGQTKNYLTNCEIELQRSRKLIYDFKRKGISIIGVDRIKCDPDGTFSPVQCTLKNCFCTDKEGVGIKSYHPDIKIDVNMTCNCAREEIYQLNMMFRCTEWGDYQPSTCVDNHCICVDNDGDIISSNVGKTLSEEDREKTCEKLREDLTKNLDDSDDNDKSTDGGDNDNSTDGGDDNSTDDGDDYSIYYD